MTVFRSLVLAALVMGSPAVACTKPGSLDNLRAETVRAVNAVRKDAGLAPLSVNRRLTSTAQGHSCDMARRTKMTHTGSDGSSFDVRVARGGYKFSTSYENVGSGFSTPTTMLKAWMNSPPHRANVLSRDAKDVGIGIAVGSDGAMYWTMLGAAPR